MPDLREEVALLRGKSRKMTSTMHDDEKPFNNAFGAKVEFLRAELDTGLTLATIALHPAHEDKTSRNRTNARTAYDSVPRFIPRAQLTPKETDEIKSALEVLRSKLRELGEDV